MFLFSILGASGHVHDDLVIKLDFNCESITKRCTQYSIVEQNYTSRIQPVRQFILTKIKIKEEEKGSLLVPQEGIRRGRL